MSKGAPSAAPSTGTSAAALGIVFDIREFTVHDGPGIRTTVFMKGCPLRCEWCHNPEGQSVSPEVMRGPAGERITGREYSADQLAGILNKQAAILRENEGGVTFSGGEPLLQAAFVAEVIDRLDRVHVLLDTSGYASEPDFRLVAERADLVFFDLKLMDREQHRRYTGAFNDLILHNLHVLSEIGVPFVARVPLVPGVTDADENLSAIAAALRGLPGLRRVDLLPYNKAAGAKYPLVGREFKPQYDEAREPNINLHPFQRVDIPVRVA